MSPSAITALSTRQPIAHVFQQSPVVRAAPQAADARGDSRPAPLSLSSWGDRAVWPALPAVRCVAHHVDYGIHSAPSPAMKSGPETTTPSDASALSRLGIPISTPCCTTMRGVSA